MSLLSTNFCTLRLSQYIELVEIKRNSKNERKLTVCNCAIFMPALAFLEREISSNLFFPLRQQICDFNLKIVE